MSSASSPDSPPNKRRKSESEKAEFILKKQKQAEKFMREHGHLNWNIWPENCSSHASRTNGIIPGPIENGIQKATLIRKRSCFICGHDVCPVTAENVIACQGQMSGEMDDGKLLDAESRPIRQCMTKFHPTCISNYNAGAFNFLYSARPDCQGLLLCPLHCCESCNADHQKQSAYAPDVIECMTCYRAFHPDCFPAGGKDITVEFKIGNKQIQFGMMQCCDHSMTPTTERDCLDDRIDMCCSEDCDHPREKLIQCTTCVNSFHKKCKQIKVLDWKAPPSKQCDRCVSGSAIPVSELVFGLHPIRECFHVGIVMSTYTYPTSKRSNVLYDKTGYAVVQWLSKISSNHALSIVPTYNLSKYIEEYITLLEDNSGIEQWFTQREKEYWRRYPKVYKKVYRTAQICTVSESHESMLKLSEVEDDCNCEGPRRCTTESCEFFGTRFECTPACDKRQGECQNRRVSTGFVHPNFEIKATVNKGMGAFATEDIDSSEILCNMVGEIITAEEKDRRKEILETANDCQASHYFMRLQNGWIIDASQLGNEARYLNHSCQPNCIFETIYVYAKKNRRGNLYYPRVAVKTIRKIKKGEELTVSYADDSFPTCRCDAPNCDGRMSKKG